LEGQESEDTGRDANAAAKAVRGWRRIAFSLAKSPKVILAAAVEN